MTPKLLIVEDSRAQRRFIRHQLAGVDIIIDACGSIGEMPTSNGYAAMLLDLELPDSQGADTVRAAKERLPNVPIIVYTANDNPDVLERCFAFGADEVLVKDITTPRQILDAVMKAIESRKLAMACHDCHDSALQTTMQMNLLREKLAAIGEAVAERLVVCGN